MKNSLWSILVSLLFLPTIQANELVDTLQNRLHSYHLEKPIINLYVHLDRNTYTPEDTIWFKAYVLNPILNEVLYVRITDRKKNVVLSKQFPVYDIRAHGDILLPDTLPEGHYLFYAYTDRMISFNPNDVFVQPITVSKNIVNRLEAQASVTNLRKIHRGDKVEVLARVRAETSKSLRGKYSLWVGERLLKKGSLTTNSLGEAYIRFTYPKIDDTEMVRCEIRFAQDKDFAELILNLRHEGNTAKVSAFAEGGHFLDGIPNRTVFEVVDDQKNPLSVPLDLMEGQRIIRRVHTNKNGLASMDFTPRLNVPYSLAVHENDTTTLLKFPGLIEANGYALKVEAGTNGTTAVLANKGMNDSATLVLRNMDQIIWSETLKINSGDSTRIELPLRLQPKSMLNLAVFDTLAKPLAERCFLSSTENPHKVTFAIAKSMKKGQNSVQVNLLVTDAANNPVASNVSVSVVEKNSLDRSRYRTILQAYFYKNLFGPGSTLHDEQEPDFDDRLITTNWGRASWENLVRFRPTGYIRLLENTGGLTGYVTTTDQKPYKLKGMMLESTTSADKKELAPLLKMFQGGTSQQRNTSNVRNIRYTIKDWMEPVNVNENGYFSIPPKSLLVNTLEVKILHPGSIPSNEYNIQLNDYSVEMDAFVRFGEALNFRQPVNNFTKYEAPAQKTLTKVVQLKEVSVESKSGLYDLSENVGRKEDYVCREYNVFNCRNHRTGGLKPMIGRVYMHSERGRLFVFNGVGKPFTPAPEGAAAGSIAYLPIKNINRPNSFYNPETSDSLFLKAETRTTVYWAPNLYTDSTGKISFKCNTSDRSGEFIIVVQGIDVKTRKPIFGTYEYKL